MRRIIQLLITAAHCFAPTLVHGESVDPSTSASASVPRTPPITPGTSNPAVRTQPEERLGEPTLTSTPAIPLTADSPVSAPAPTPSWETPAPAPLNKSPSSVAPEPSPAQSTTLANVAPPEETRVQPPQVITKAAFGKGVLVATEDEAFTFNIRARMQIQAMYYDAHDEAASDITQVQVRRARVLFQGNVHGPELTYYIQLAFSNRDTEPDLRLPLRDAYFTYAPQASVNLRFGQMKIPYGRQRVVSSSAQGMVDRSIVTTELNLDRDVGVQMFSKDLLGETLGYAVGVFGGDGRNRVATNSGYLYVGRLSLTPFGSFDDLVEADVGRDARPRLSIAAGAAYNQATNRPQSTIGSPYADPSVFFDYAHFGVDFSFKWHGFFATGEWMLRRANARAIEIEDAEGEAISFATREAWGAYLQLGQMLTDSLELSARFGHLNPLRETDPKLSLTQELGGGLSYYFEEHNLKVQSDYFYYARNPKFEAGDHQVRVQTQLFF